MISNNEIIVFDYGEDVIKLYYQDNNAQFIEFFSLSSFPGEQKRYLETAKKIRTFLHDKHIQTKNAALCISAKNVFIKKARIPSDRDENFEILVQNYVISNFPFNTQDTTIDYLITEQESTPDGDFAQVIIAAVPNYIIEKHLGFIADIGLEASIITLAQLGVIRAYNQIAPITDGCTLCIDLGFSKTDLIFIKKGELSFYRSLALGGEAFYKELSDYFQVPGQELHQLFNGIDLDSNVEPTVYRIGKKDPAEVVEHVLETLIIDIKRTIGYFINNEQGNDIEKIVLFGGYSNIININKYFAKRIGVKTTAFPFDPLRLQSARVNPALFESDPKIYSSSINLIGCKKLIDENKFINLINADERGNKPDTESNMKSTYKAITKDESKSVFIKFLYKYFFKIAIFFKPVSKLNTKPLKIINNKNMPSVILIAGVFIVIIYYLILRVNIIMLERNLEKNQKTLEVLNKQAEELDSYRARIDRINDENSTLGSSFNKNSFTQFFDYFIRYKASNQIDFIRIELSREKNEIHIIGDSRDGNIIAEFIKELQKNTNVRNAEVVYITQKDNAFEFELLISVK